MKILIPLTILVLSFIVYYFFADSPKRVQTTSAPVNTEVLAPADKDIVTVQNYIPSLANMKVEEKSADKAYLTLDDLKKKNQPVNQKAHLAKVPVQKSFNEEIFKQLKSILQKSSSTYYAKKHIVLNSPISSILTTQNAKEKFKTFLGSDFGLDAHTIEQQFKKNRRVWDWVMFLAP